MVSLFAVKLDGKSLEIKVGAQARVCVRVCVCGCFF